MFPISGPLAPGDGSARPAGNSNAPGKGDAFAAAAARLSAARALRNRTLRRIAADLKSPRSAAELKAYAAAHPEDPEALWLLAQRANSEDRLEEALVLFANCLELAPILSPHVSALRNCSAASIATGRRFRKLTGSSQPTAATRYFANSRGMSFPPSATMPPRWRSGTNW